MAEAFFNHYARGRAVAVSAGTEPAEAIDPVVVEVMREVGIDIGCGVPKRFSPDMLGGVDRVVTMGCGEEEVCPASFIVTEDWGLEDVMGKPVEKVREIRDQIEKKVKALLNKLLQEGQ